MSVVYDYEIVARDDPLVLLAINAMDIGVVMMTPERAMILKMFPFRECSTSLRRKVNHSMCFAVLNLPDWCPGSSIKRDARVSTNLSKEMVNVPFDYVKQHMVRIYSSRHC
jgi:hypothetical protein